MLDTIRKKLDIVGYTVSLMEKTPFTLADANEVNGILNDKSYFDELTKDKNINRLASAAPKTQNEVNGPIIYKIAALQVAKFMIGSDNTQEKKNNSLLVAASQKSNKYLIETLLNLEADVNAKDKHGNTALMIAVRENKNGSNKDIILELIARGADVSIQNNEGKTARTIKAPIDPDFALACYCKENSAVLLGTVTKDIIQGNDDGMRFNMKNQSTDETGIYMRVAENNAALGSELLSKDLSKINEDFKAAEEKASVLASETMPSKTDKEKFKTWQNNNAVIQNQAAKKYFDDVTSDVHKSTSSFENDPFRQLDEKIFAESLALKEEFIKEKRRTDPKFEYSSEDVTSQQELTAYIDRKSTVFAAYHDTCAQVIGDRKITPSVELIQSIKTAEEKGQKARADKGGKGAADLQTIGSQSPQQEVNTIVLN